MQINKPNKINNLLKINNINNNKNKKNNLIFIKMCIVTIMNQNIKILMIMNFLQLNLKVNLIQIPSLKILLIIFRKICKMPKKIKLNINQLNKIYIKKIKNFIKILK